MNNNDMEYLMRTNLSPWIQKATRLKEIPRKIYGGTSNMFRHQMQTMSILIDHNCIETVTLKSSVIHDLIEEYPDEDKSLLERIDSDGIEVVKTVIELTKSKDEPKYVYLERIQKYGSDRAKIIKAADRIDNLLQINLANFPGNKVETYLLDTERYIVPSVKNINKDLAYELHDIVEKLKEIYNIGELVI